MKNVEIIFLMFMIYSFLGWIVDIVGNFLSKKQIVNRGFFIGPYCPIYGFGALFITFFLHLIPVQNYLFVFISCILICSFLEYMTSYVLEKLFHARWWDYSDHRFHINGRVSLTTSLGFGTLGLILVYIFNPFFLKIIKNIPTLIFNIIMIIIFLIFISDVITSYKIISKLKKDGYENIRDITEKANEEVKKVLKNKSIFNRRLLSAFPHLKFIGNRKNK